MLKTPSCFGGIAEWRKPDVSDRSVLLRDFFNSPIGAKRKTRRPQHLTHNGTPNLGGPRTKEEAKKFHNRRPSACSMFPPHLHGSSGRSLRVTMRRMPKTSPHRLIAFLQQVRHFCTCAKALATQALALIRLQLWPLHADATLGPPHH